MGLAVALGMVYVVATLGLVVFLEVWLSLATFAPAILPALAAVGALNLAMIARQEQREASIRAEKAQLRRRRRESRDRTKDVHTLAQPSVRGQGPATQMVVQNNVLEAVNHTRRERKAAYLDAMIDIYLDNPAAGATEVARRLDIGRSTVYNYLKDLEAAPRIASSILPVPGNVQGKQCHLDV